MHEQGRSPVPGRARFGHAALMSLPKKWRTNVKHIFLAAAFTLATIASANADTTCVVNSPDGELNVRDLTRGGPGGITDKLRNGYTITIRDFYFFKGQSWARVLDGKTRTSVVGWVFKDYLDCDQDQKQVSLPNASTYHYACKNGDDRYALTVNEKQRIVKLIARAPTRPIMTFLIQGMGDCGKYGWALSNGAQFCTATQGYGSLEWRGKEYECDLAETD
jgi:hypothetical protein